MLRTWEGLCAGGRPAACLSTASDDDFEVFAGHHQRIRAGAIEALQQFGQVLRQGSLAGLVQGREGLAVPSGIDSNAGGSRRIACSGAYSAAPSGAATSSRGLRSALTAKRSVMAAATSTSALPIA